MNFSLLSLFGGRQLPAPSQSSRLDNTQLISTSPGAKHLDSFDKLPSTSTEFYSKTYPTFEEARDAFMNYSVHLLYASGLKGQRAITEGRPSNKQQSQVLTSVAS
jgi:hypothetical protein